MSKEQGFSLPLLCHQSQKRSFSPHREVQNICSFWGMYMTSLRAQGYHSAASEVHWGYWKVNAVRQSSWGVCFFKFSRILTPCMDLRSHPCHLPSPTSPSVTFSHPFSFTSSTGSMFTNDYRARARDTETDSNPSPLIPSKPLSLRTCKRARTLH